MKRVICAFSETMGYLGFWYLVTFTASLPIGKTKKNIKRY